MKKIKVIISVLIAVPALMIFAGESPAEMMPVQLLAGGVLLGVIALNGGLIKGDNYES